jgi:hypothetical protein
VTKIDISANDLQDEGKLVIADSLRGSDGTVRQFKCSEWSIEDGTTLDFTKLTSLTVAGTSMMLPVLKASLYLRLSKIPPDVVDSGQPGLAHHMYNLQLLPTENTSFSGQVAPLYSLLGSCIWDDKYPLELKNKVSTEEGMIVEACVTTIIDWYVLCVGML